MRVAVLGATGAVGRTMLRVLEERSPEVAELVPLASPRSAGAELTWRGRAWRVEAPAPGCFQRCDVALFSAGSALSRAWAPVAAGEGAVVVDNSSAWRLDPEVPLVVPEVNGARAADRPKGIIANPNCSTIQMTLPLEALRRAAGLVRVVASTYQSVSGAGQTGIRAYETELRGGTDPGSPFPAPIVGNVIPRIGAERPGGWTEEEAKMRGETRKILELADLPVSVTCVRVPVAVGHCVAATVELQRAVGRDEAVAALRAMPGLRLSDADPLPREVAGCDDVRVGRLRQDPDFPNVYHMWIVADNLRKGAATNAVQIAGLVGRG